MYHKITIVTAESETSLMEYARKEFRILSAKDILDEFRNIVQYVFGLERQREKEYPSVKGEK